jgi:hypothetical protein
LRSVTHRLRNEGRNSGHLLQIRSAKATAGRLYVANAFVGEGGRVAAVSKVDLMLLRLLLPRLMMLQQVPVSISAAAA